MWSKLWKAEPHRIQFLIQSFYEVLPSSINLFSWGLIDTLAYPLYDKKRGSLDIKLLLKPWERDLSVVPRPGAKGHLVHLVQSWHRSHQHRDLSEQAPAASTALDRICQGCRETTKVQEPSRGTSGNSPVLAAKGRPVIAAQIPRNHRHDHAKA